MNETNSIDNNFEIEIQDWIESLDNVLEFEGKENVNLLLDEMIDHLRRKNVYLPYKATTAYVNSISQEEEPRFPGDL